MDRVAENDRHIGARAADLILHPVRMRILLALGRGEALTATGLEALLPDVARASLYRHLAVLANGGVLEVVAERRVRGAVERTYALPSGAGVVRPEDVIAMSRDEHMRYFATFLATLLDEFSRYVRRPRIDPPADGLSYRQAAFYLTDAEFAELVRELSDAVARRVGMPPGPGRKSRTVATIAIPGEPVVGPADSASAG